MLQTGPHLLGVVSMSGVYFPLLGFRNLPEWGWKVKKKKTQENTCLEQVVSMDTGMGDCG